MSGRVPRQVRPVLLLVVYGVFLVVVGVTATVQTALVSLHFSTAAINTAVAGDAAIVRAFVNDGLAAGDLTDAADPARVERLDGLLAALAGNAGMRRLEIRDPSGTVRLTSAAGLPVDAALRGGGRVSLCRGRGRSGPGRDPRHAARRRQPGAARPVPAARRGR